MSHQTICAGPFTADVAFHQRRDHYDNGQRPYTYAGATPPPGLPSRNYELEPHTVTIEDIRGRESCFTLDKHAFTTATAPTSWLSIRCHSPRSFPANSSDVDDDDDDDDVNNKDKARSQERQTNLAKYYAEVEHYLVTSGLLSGAEKALVYDHQVRSGANPTSANGPVHSAHADESRSSLAARVRHCLRDQPPAEVDALLQPGRRVRSVTLWRPLTSTAEQPLLDHPLAIVDFNSVRDSELTSVDVVHSWGTAEAYRLVHQREQRWYYWSGMTRGEMLVLQNADTKLNAREIEAEAEAKASPAATGTAGATTDITGTGEQGILGRICVPVHSAVTDPRTPADAPVRQSIEVRALVFGG